MRRWVAQWSLLITLARSVYLVTVLPESSIVSRSDPTLISVRYELVALAPL